VYFPITALPAVLQWLSYVFPLWHAVVLCRAATLPGAGLGVPEILGHLTYLAAWAATGFWLATLTFRRRLAT
jgi:lipooligosaccharide transport system permease protein